MSKQQKIPKLRFPGFLGEWEERKLGEITVWASGGTPSKEVDSYWNGDIPWISASSMRGIEYANSELKLTKEGLSKGSKLAKKDTLLLLVRGSMLFNTIPIGIAIRDVAFNQDVKSIVPTEVTTSKYLLYWFIASEHLLLSMVVGTGIGAGKLETSELKMMSIPLPTLPEQQKIAHFLTAIDEKINQLTRQKALLEQYKKGVMQQIFSRELRFRDGEGRAFGEWEYLKAKAVFKNQSNKNHKGDLPILAITQDKGAVLRDSLDKDIISSEASVNSYKIVEPGDFIISLRSFQGGIEFSDVLGICSPAYTILKSVIPIVPEFFKYYLKKDSFIQELSNTVIGIREGKQISFDAFSSLILPYPTLPEQQKIADFLTALDEKIGRVSGHVEAVKGYKKGLLQGMFV
jgi:type I restriction enzyme S subunit